LIRAAILAAILQGLSGLRAEEPRSIESNFLYRQTWGDLGVPGSIVTLPAGSRRAVHLGEGAGQLLDLCQQHSATWQKDPLIFRLAHRGAATSIGCREKSSPSLHVVFYAGQDGEREAWAHFDLHGPQNPLVHMTEVFRNRMTFGRTSSHEVYRGLVRTNVYHHPESTESVPFPRYDLRAHTREYLHNIAGANATGVAAATGVFSLALRNSFGDRVTETYRDRIKTNLLRNTIQHSIEFATAAFLQQDQRFITSGELGFSRRVKIALRRSFFVPGRDGDELAFPRIAAAMFTPVAMRSWNPRRTVPQNPWVQTGFLLARYVMRSYWAEFKPEIKNSVRKILRRPTAHGRGV
jgi:hypothetical protein